MCGEFMNKNYIPTWYIPNVLKINMDQLISRNYQYLFCDIDNTLVSPFVALPDEKVINWVQQIKNCGIKIVLISNNSEERVALFAKKLNVDYIYKTKKPNPKKVLEYIHKQKIDKKKVLAIGDQIMTDVLCANRAKIDVLLVEKLEKKEQFITFFPRRLDIFIRKRLKRKNLLRKF